MGEGAGFERYTASLIVVSGSDEGEEHRVERPRWVVGRGPGVDVAFADRDMARQHAAIEFVRGGFQLCELDGERGVEVNGRAVARCPLSHGDRIRIGTRVFQILIERKDGPAPLRALPADPPPRS